MGSAMSSKQTDSKIINFMALRIPATALSVIMLVVAIAALVVNGVKFGLDFTGGAQVEVHFSEPADIPEIRNILNEQGLINPVAVLFGSDSDVLIRTQGAMSDGGEQALKIRLDQLSAQATIVSIAPPPRERSNFAQQITLSGVKSRDINDAIFAPEYFGVIEVSAAGDEVHIFTENSLDAAYTTELLDVLAAKTNSEVELRRSEYVGPQVGAELRDEGGLGMLLALAAVMLYVAARLDRKSTRLNSSHVRISYAVFCLKKKKKINSERLRKLAHIARVYYKDIAPVTTLQHFQLNLTQFGECPQNLS